MKKMNVLVNFRYMDSFNAIMGAVIAFLTFVFGQHWYLFASFLFFNLIDWITGWLKAKINKKVNSEKGWQGVVKKIGYWLMIMVAFSLSAIFMELGQTLGIDLSVTTLLGWFVLASLLINETRSILENLVEAGYHVPSVLVKGLEIADQLINKDNAQDEEQNNEKMK